MLRSIIHVTAGFRLAQITVKVATGKNESPYRRATGSMAIHSAVKDIRSVHGSQSSSDLLSPYLAGWKFQPAVKDGQSVSAPIDSNPKIPVLMDGVFVHTSTPRNTEWKVDVTLPNLTCEKCTLQVTQFMAQHGLNPGGGFYYHHCADLQITADPTLPAADKAWRQLGK